MQFRLLLKWLKDRYAIGEFDSGRVASALALKKKLVSNDLRRLYRMGFLKRKRVKRSCIGRRGFINRGFQYTYSVSRHGLSYVGWLEKGKVVEDFAVAGLRSDAILRLPDDMKRGVLTVQMAEEVKPYRGPGSGYKPSPSDLLLSLYTNIDRERVMADFREIRKEFVKASSDVSRLSSEKASLHLENVFWKIVNQSLEKERDLWKKETNDLFWASSRALVEDTQISGEMFQKASQVIEFYRSFLVTLVICLRVLFPSKAVDRLIDFAWELDKASRKRASTQKEVQPSTSPNPSTEAKLQEPSKIKTRIEEIDWIYGEDEYPINQFQRLCLNEMARIIRQKKKVTIAELCTQMKLEATTVHEYACRLQDVFPDIKFENGILHTVLS